MFMMMMIVMGHEFERGTEGGKGWIVRGEVL
jgi:hypothetical protein